MLLRFALILTVVSAFGSAQAPTAPAAAPIGKRVCVADVANSSVMPVATDQVKERLVSELQKAGANAEDSPSATMLASVMDLSFKNQKAIKRLNCDYMLLSEVAKSKADRLRLDFALFRRGVEAAVLRDSVEATGDAKLTESVLAATPAAAAKISGALKMKAKMPATKVKPLPSTGPGK